MKMSEQNNRKARLNARRLSYSHSLKSLTTNLLACSTVEHREYINKYGQHQVYLVFQFGNSSSSMSIEPTDEVKGLLSDFRDNTGLFSNAEQ